MQAAVFRAAARSLAFGLGDARRKAGNKSCPRPPHKPVARYRRRDPRNKPSAVEPGMPQRRLSCRLGNGSRSMTMRPLD